MGGFNSVTTLETIVFADNASFDGTERGGALTTNGQLWIGSTALPHVKRGTITSPLGTIAIGYNSPNITMDIVGGAVAVEHLTGNTGGQLNPDGSNNFNILGATQLAGTTPFTFAGVGSNLTGKIQISQAIAGTDATKIGLSNYSSTNFSVDANGFVTSATITLTNGVNGVFSAANTNLGGSISLRSDILTRTVPGAYPYTALSTDYVIEVDTASARTINLPNAPTTGKSYVIKDVIGSAAANNITLTTVGGVVTIDGATSRTLASNYVSVTVYFNGTSYFIL